MMGFHDGIRQRVETVNLVGMDSTGCVVTDWRRVNRLRLRCSRFQKFKNLLHLTVGGVFDPTGCLLAPGGEKQALHDRLTGTAVYPKDATD